MFGGQARTFSSSSSLLLSSLELSDTRVYEPEIQALLGTHFGSVVALKLRSRRAPAPESFKKQPFLRGLTSPIWAALCVRVVFPDFRCNVFNSAGEENLGSHQNGVGFAFDPKSFKKSSEAAFRLLSKTCLRLNKNQCCVIDRSKVVELDPCKAIPKIKRLALGFTGSGSSSDPLRDRPPAAPPPSQGKNRY